MNRKRNWVVGIILTTIVGFVALKSGLPASTDTATPTNLIIPTVTPASDGCAYTWTYHDAPDLTQKLDAAVRNINTNANARAELFGEDCVYADGRSTFGVMETDFYIRLPAENLTDEEVLGNWMATILQIILQTPHEEIQGNYGFVEFWFEKSNAEHLIVRVPIQKYIDGAQGKTGAELFHMFYVAQ
jgi:hypothetical protein